MKTAAVVIGRNEGERLVKCLEAIINEVDEIIYVDSGSSDGSLENAQKLGATVVSLDTQEPFTAARARNFGILQLDGNAKYIQVIDGDCEIVKGWIERGIQFLEQHPNVAVVAGRLREKYPDRTVWNMLADHEWDTPIGETTAVGGIALLRACAFAAVGGYREDLIAGEEPELCLRLRRIDWQVWRIPDEMAKHDIAMTRFRQWWRRMRRGGFSFAEGAARHGKGPERYRVNEVIRTVFWGILIPVFAIIGSLFFGPSFLCAAIAYPIQVLRIWLAGIPLYRSFFLTLGKFPEALGVIEYLWKRRLGKQNRIIEYK